VARVESPFTEPATAPKQGDEGVADAWLVFQDAFLGALDGLRPGDAVIVLTWLHRAEREVLRVHSRDDPGTRSAASSRPARPTAPAPVRLHELEVVAVEGPPRARRGRSRRSTARRCSTSNRCPAGLGPASVTVADIYGAPPWPDLAVAN
jgi:hypothetical protein